METRDKEDQFIDLQDKLGITALAVKLGILPYELRAIIREVGRNIKDIEAFVTNLK